MPATLTWLATALSAGLALGAEAAPYVISVGSNRGLAHELPLRFAEADATRFAEVMQVLGGVPRTNTRLLLGASPDSVRGVLHELARRTAAAPVSRLVVFYSGHAGGDGLHMNGGVLPSHELERALIDVSAALRVVAIDACQAGGMTQVKGIRPAPEFDLRVVGVGTTSGIAVLTSSTAGEESYESERLQSSFFAHHLIAGLKGAADGDADGAVTLEEVYRFSYRQTLRSTAGTARLQHPTFRYDLMGRESVVLTRLDSDDQRWGQIELGERGAYLIASEHEQGPLVAELVAERAGTRLMVAPGGYFIQRRDVDHYLEYRVDVRAQGRTRLDRDRARRVGYAQLVRKGSAQRGQWGTFLLGSARGPVLLDTPLLPSAVAGVSLDLPFASLSLRGRYGQAGYAPSAGGLSGLNRELALGLTVQRCFDVGNLTAGAGLSAEGALLSQSFPAAGGAPGRSSTGFSFGPLLSIESRVTGPFLGRLEAGALTTVFRRARLDGGAVVGSEVGLVLAPWMAAGVGVWL